ncbi:MAG: Zn-dependent membrane protease YugP [Crocinitomix sp.]|jgi:Zn-dependent membrane protease YugP
MQGEGMMTYYLGPMIIGGVFMLISWLVGSMLKRKFAKYSKLHMANGMTGREVAERMLKDNGIYDVKVIAVKGQLTDHYHPTHKTVNLSEAVYNKANAAAVAVAAHECGHAVQHARAYKPLNLRSKLVPIQNASGKVLNIVVIGMIFLGGALGGIAPFMIYIIIAAQAAITLFALVTLPVEFDASKRALAWINDNGIVTTDEYDGAKDALKWAAMTYVVAALAAVATLVYYIIILMNRR